MGSIIRMILVLGAVMDCRRKNSKKREALLTALRSVTSHPTAEALYQALKPDWPELSLGTVYRNLSVLAEEGLITSVATVEGQLRYDARTEPHAHFICRRCRSVIDLELPDVVTPLYGAVGESLGCEAETHALNIRGLCAACRRT